MNAHTLRVLEYEQIKTMLAGYASCELGKRVITGLEPRCDEEAVRRALQETSEAQRLIDVAGSIPLGGVHDVREAVRAAAMGSLLEASTLLSVADTFGAAWRLRAFVLKREEEAPHLAERARHLGGCSAIVEEIRRCINERGEVERVLGELAGRIGARAPEATGTLEVLGEIDFVAAKAKLGFALRCSEPVINNTGEVKLRQARHPLLRGDVVPIDVRLGEA